MKLLVQSLAGESLEMRGSRLCKKDAGDTAGQGEHIGNNTGDNSRQPQHYNRGRGRQGRGGFNRRGNVKH